MLDLMDMGKINLTTAQKTALVFRHKQTRDSRECDRIKAVLLSAKGWRAPHIAEALLIEESSVRRHVKEYQKAQKLTNDNGGSTERLSASQSEELIAHLTDHLYQHNHLVWPLSRLVLGWLTRYRVCINGCIGMALFISNPKGSLPRWIRRSKQPSLKTTPI